MIYISEFILTIEENSVKLKRSAVPNCVKYTQRKKLYQQLEIKDK